MSASPLDLKLSCLCSTRLSLPLQFSQTQRTNVSHKHKFDHSAKASWHQSASTWRHSTPTISFTKSPRFPAPKPSHLDVAQLNLPSSISRRATSQGFGQRAIRVVEERKRELAAVPSPDQYQLDVSVILDDSPSRRRGRSFGVSRNCYEKVFQPQARNLPYAEFLGKDNPCAQYEVREQPGRSSRKSSLSGRLKMFNELAAHGLRHVPGPIYQVREKLGEMRRSLAGRARRIDLAKPLHDNPGPGSYELRA